MSKDKRKIKEEKYDLHKNDCNCKWNCESRKQSYFGEGHHLKIWMRERERWNGEYNLLITQKNRRIIII